MNLSTEYPKWKYHRSLPACTVQDPEQEANLGDGWADHPSAFDAEPEMEPVAEPSVKVLRSRKLRSE
jgi:hypothetical protein